MEDKRRRFFVGYKQLGYNNIPTRLCTGLLYDEGNVQVLWRKDIGHTAQQYDSIAKVFDLIPGLNRVDIRGEHNEKVDSESTGRCGA